MTKVGSMLHLWPLMSVIVLAGCDGVKFIEEEDVIVLDSSNFDEALRRFPLLFVEFREFLAKH